MTSRAIERSSRWVPATNATKTPVTSSRARSRRPFATAVLVVAFVLPAAASGEELGRLFFTPQQRRALDLQRQLAVGQPRVIPDDPTLTIDGVVARSSGKRTVWINGMPLKETDVAGELAVSPSPGNPARIVVRPRDTSAAEVRVGGTINRNTGETSDLLGPGRVSIKRAP